MGLESTYVCVDNSDYMRNGDFVPTRLQAQQDAVNLVCHSKTRSNPENNVGLIAMSKNPEVLVTLTSDVGRVLSRLHQVQSNGNMRFSSGVRVAHLALKHRQGKNHKMRIIAFVGSPVEEDPKELIKLAKRLKKEKVNVDVINFGEQDENSEKLTNFVNTINGKEGASSHLVTVPPGPMLSDALMNSPIVVGEDGTGAPPSGMAGFEFGIDPNDDPELALALRVSMEEQRARQEDEARKVAAQSAAEVSTPAGEDPKTPAGFKRKLDDRSPAARSIEPFSKDPNARLSNVAESSEDAMLKQALEMSMQPESEDSAPNTAAPQEFPDFAGMTEEEQIAYAMQMSMAAGGEDEAMETDTGDEKKPGASGEKDEDYSEVINDPEFLQSVLEGLPGVDPQSEAIRSAMGALQKDDKKDGKKEDKK